MNLKSKYSNPEKTTYWVLIILGLILILTFSSCRTTKEMRVCNRQAKKVEKAVAKCPSMRIDSIFVRDTLTVVVPEIKVDTVVLKADTIQIVKDRWRVRIIEIGDSLAIDGGCDTDTLYVPFEVPCPPVVSPTIYKAKPLAWWQIALMCLGGFWIVMMVFRIVSKLRPSPI